MRRRIIAGLVAGLMLVISLVSPGAAAEEDRARIVHLAAYREDGNLKLRFGIEDCFTPKMIDAIKSGVVTTFRIRVVVEEPGLPLFRKQLLNTVLEHSLEFDQLRGEYRLKLAERAETPIRTTDFSEARQLMSTVSGIPVLPLWRLQPGKTYNIRVKAELSKVRLPVFLRYIFFFVSLWDFETDWQQVPFRY